MRKKNEKRELNCEFCDNTFITGIKSAKYCSESCCRESYKVKPITDVNTRICKDCNIEKPLEDIVKDNRNITGYTNRCKDCRNADINSKYIPKIAATEGEQVCARCKLSLDVKLFNKCTSAANGRAYICKICSIPLRRKKYVSTLKYTRIYKIYGLTNEKYEQMLIHQDNKCKICDIEMKKPCIDHEHGVKGGGVRSILCSPCNTGLGCFKDDPELMRKAADYIEDYNNRNVGDKNERVAT